MEEKDIEFAKTRIIGWKACKYLDHAMAIVKLEIDPDDVISNPVIRETKFNTGFYKACSDKEARLIANPYGNYDHMMDITKMLMEDYIKSYGMGIYRTTDIMMLGCENVRVIEDAVNYMKCRCAKAKVLKINAIDDPSIYVSKAVSLYDNDFVYRTGDIVKPSNMDELDFDLTTGRRLEQWSMNICGPGIHYFKDWKAAILYGAIQTEWSITIERVYELLFGNGKVIFDG